MKLETAFASHRGGRDEQQDRVAVLSAPDGDARLLVVADGMGGHAGGSIAAQAVVDAADAAWKSYDARKGDPKALLRGIVESAHAAINAAGHEKGLSPRSTCVILYLDGLRAVWVHVGDSRLYRFRGGRMIERTRDHSVVQMLLDMGKISEEEMGTHPDQNRLTQSMGGESDPEPDFGEQAVEPGDSFILCSDGLWEMVSPEEMAAGISSEALPKLADKLPAVAFERAGAKSDNISIAVARLGGATAAAATVAEARPAKRRRGALWGAVAVVLVLGIGGVVALTQFSGPSSETNVPLSPTVDPPAKPTPTPAPAPKPDPKPTPTPKPGEKPTPTPAPGPAPTPKTDDKPTPAPDRAPPTKPTPAPKSDGPQGTQPGPTTPAKPKSGDVDDRKSGAPGPRPSETPPPKDGAPKTVEPSPRGDTGPTEAAPAPKGRGDAPGADPNKPGEGTGKSGQDAKPPEGNATPRTKEPPSGNATPPSPSKDGSGSGAQ